MLGIEAKQKYLIKLGINSRQIYVKGYRESQPIADNNTESNRQANRRVEVRVIE